MNWCLLLLLLFVLLLPTIFIQSAWGFPHKSFVKSLPFGCDVLPDELDLIWIGFICESVFSPTHIKNTKQIQNILKM